MELAKVIALVESNNNQFAQRFERLHLGATNPGTIARIIKAHDNKISMATADVYAAMSHGLFQLMGFQLYGPVLKYTKPLWTFLNSRDEQLAALQLYLTADNLQTLTAEDLKQQATRDHFALCYNGPGNVAAYSVRLLSAVGALETAGQ